VLHLKNILFSKSELSSHSLEDAAGLLGRVLVDMAALEFLNRVLSLSLQNHRNIKVGKDLQGHLVQLSSYWQYFPSEQMSLSTTSKFLLSTSSDGDSTISLGSLFKDLTAPLEKKFLFS